MAMRGAAVAAGFAELDADQIQLAVPHPAFISSNAVARFSSSEMVNRSIGLSTAFFWCSNCETSQAAILEYL
jgi:hypothetical protein